MNEGWERGHMSREIRTEPTQEPMADSSANPGPDRLLTRLKNEYLSRLARFALIDDVPAPWVGGIPATEPAVNGPVDQPNA